MGLEWFFMLETVFIFFAVIAFILIIRALNEALKILRAERKKELQRLEQEQYNVAHDYTSIPSRRGNTPKKRYKHVREIQ